VTEVSCFCDPHLYCVFRQHSSPWSHRRCGTGPRCNLWDRSVTATAQQAGFELHPRQRCRCGCCQWWCCSFTGCSWCSGHWCCRRRQRSSSSRRSFPQLAGASRRQLWHCDLRRDGLPRPDLACGSRTRVVSCCRSSAPQLPLRNGLLTCVGIRTEPLFLGTHRHRTFDISRCRRRGLLRRRRRPRRRGHFAGRPRQPHLDRWC
jgi:hypothetical protein